MSGNKSKQDPGLSEETLAKELLNVSALNTPKVKYVINQCVVFFSYFEVTLEKLDDCIKTAKYSVTCRIPFSDKLFKEHKGAFQFLPLETATRYAEYEYIETITVTFC